MLFKYPIAEATADATRLQIASDCTRQPDAVYCEITCKGKLTAGDDATPPGLPSEEPKSRSKEVTMYQGRTPKVLNTLPALIAMAMLAACNVASAASTAPAGAGAP